MGTFVASASLTMVIPFLPLFLIDLGVDEHRELWSGLLFSCTFLASAISSPYLGSLADKYGRKKMIIRAGLVLVIVFSLMAFVTNPYQLLGLRLLHGFLAGYIPAVTALIGTNTPEANVGYALTSIATATASGRIMGPLLGGAISQVSGNRAAFAVAGIMILLSTLSVIFMVREEKLGLSRSRSSVLDSFKFAIHNKSFLSVMILSCVVSLSIMTIEPVLSLYVAELGGAENSTALISGVVFSLVGITGVLFSTSWGRLADRVGFRTVLVIGLLGGSIGNFAQVFFNDIWGFSIVRFVYGAFFCAVIPAINGLVVKNTPSSFRGRAFGLNNTANQIGSMIGPMIGGMIGAFYNTKGIFIGTAILLLLAVVLTHFVTENQSETAKKVTTAEKHSKATS
ncbi:MFS transporter [Paenibacillus septentrionalis]|uniref:MFS transporter n=1 Tax=Paenibacillus septentrionalis TaxID=429342 RepID=A0ABW1V7W6_9BACL